MYLQTGVQTLLNHTPYFISIADLEGNYRFVNEKHSLLLGADISGVLGQSIFNRIHPGDLSEFVLAFSLVKSVGQAGFAAIRIKGDSGSWNCVSTTAINLSVNEDINGIVIIWPQAEHRLSKIEQLLFGFIC